MATIKVLLIIGRGRSGSTILGNLLGELDGFVSVGELFNVFKRGLVMGQTCGCGRSVASCALWSRVMATALATPGGPIAPADVVEWQQQVAGAADDTRKLLKVRSPEGGSTALGCYVSVLGRVYAALAEETGESVIVDSSKRPPHAAYMHLVPGISPYFVQLVRDARAVAFSRARPKHTVDKEMRIQGVRSSAAAWMRRNLLSEAVRRRYPSGRSLLVRYEDFVAHPQRTLGEIARMVGEQPGEFPFTDDKAAILRPNHSVSGNPSRFETGSVSLKIDDEWLRAQRAKDKLTTTALTWPLLLRYGYPLRPVDGRVAEAH